MIDLVRRAASTNGRIEYLGRLDRRGVERQLADAAFLVFPSVAYEGFPLALAESFAQATPVLASRLGAAGGIVQDGESGLHFDPGNAADLATKATWLAANGRECRAMGQRAREVFESKYTEKRILDLLLSVFAEAQAEAVSRYALRS